MHIGPLVHDTRRALGLSQVTLSGLAEVSLATLQSVEAGRANPSMSTLAKLLAPLGLRLGVEPEAADWEALAACGLPLAPRIPGRARVDEKTLVRLVHHALLELSRRPDLPDRERKEECLRALLFAMRSEFPSPFRAWFRGAPLVQNLLAEEPSGRVIKLSRIARESLAEIL